MSARASSNNHRQILGIVAVVVLVGALLLILKPAGPSQQIWFYDLDAAALYPAPGHTVSPSAAPSGGSGVRAQVYSCATCDESERFIAYLEKYTQEALTAMQDRNAPIDPQVLMVGHLVRAVDGNDWTPLNGPEGKMIEQSAHSRCAAGETIKVCLP